ncbi:hypothetical protein JCM24511_07527 [Saitozyma sp. JCM 24511]|nr:hypothetical protein JCM24511_07527 [Saitozyma sp. JCM 24511]
MSVVVFGGVVSPYANGMVFGHDPDDPNVFRFVAYRHPDGPHSYFGGYHGGQTEPGFGATVHTSIVSSYWERQIPEKLDFEIMAISEDEFNRLRRCEPIFWQDYNNHRALYNSTHAQAIAHLLSAMSRLPTVPQLASQQVRLYPDPPTYPVTVESPWDPVITTRLVHLTLTRAQVAAVISEERQESGFLSAVGGALEVDQVQVWVFGTAAERRALSMQLGQANLGQQNNATRSYARARSVMLASIPLAVRELVGDELAQSASPTVDLRSYLLKCAAVVRCCSFAWEAVREQELKDGVALPSAFPGTYDKDMSRLAWSKVSGAAPPPPPSTVPGTTIYDAVPSHAPGLHTAAASSSSLLLAAGQSASMPSPTLQLDRSNANPSSKRAAKHQKAPIMSKLSTASLAAQSTSAAYDPPTTQTVSTATEPASTPNPDQMEARSIRAGPSRMHPAPTSHRSETQASPHAQSPARSIHVDARVHPAPKCVLCARAHISVRCQEVTIGGTNLVPVSTYLHSRNGVKAIVHKSTGARYCLGWNFDGCSILAAVRDLPLPSSGPTLPSPMPPPPSPTRAESSSAASRRSLQLPTQLPTAAPMHVQGGQVRGDELLVLVRPEDYDSVPRRLVYKRIRPKRKQWTGIGGAHEDLRDYVAPTGPPPAKPKWSSDMVDQLSKAASKLPPILEPQPLSVECPRSQVAHPDYKARIVPDDVVSRMGNVDAALKEVVRDLFRNASVWPCTPGEEDDWIAKQRSADDTLIAEIRRLEQEAISSTAKRDEKITAERFQFPGLHHRYQRTDGFALIAPLLVQLHWPSLHNDSVVMTHMAASTRLIMAQGGVISAEHSRDLRVAQRNWHPVKCDAEQGGGMRLRKLGDEKGPLEPLSVRQECSRDRRHDFREKVLNHRKQVVFAFGAEVRTEISETLRSEMARSSDVDIVSWDWAARAPLLCEMGLDSKETTVLRNESLMRGGDSWRIHEPQHVDAPFFSTPTLKTVLRSHLVPVRRDDELTCRIRFLLMSRQRGSERGGVLFIFLVHPEAAMTVEAGKAPNELAALDYGIRFLSDLFHKRFDQGYQFVERPRWPACELMLDRIQRRDAGKITNADKGWSMLKLANDLRDVQDQMRQHHGQPTYLAHSSLPSRAQTLVDQVYVYDDPSQSHPKLTAKPEAPADLVRQLLFATGNEGGTARAASDVPMGDGRMTPRRQEALVKAQTASTTARRQQTQNFVDRLDQPYWAVCMCGQVLHSTRYSRTDFDCPLVMSVKISEAGSIHPRCDCHKPGDTCATNIPLDPGLRAKALWYSTNVSPTAAGVPPRRDIAPTKKRRDEWDGAAEEAIKKHGPGVVERGPSSVAEQTPPSQRRGASGHFRLNSETE